MVTSITHLSAKDVKYLQPHRSLKWCERQLASAKKAYGAGTALLKHLASFWGIEDDDLIFQLRPRFQV